jgi:hypothetical protein
MSFAMRACTAVPRDETMTGLEYATAANVSPSVVRAAIDGSDLRAVGFKSDDSGPVRPAYDVDDLAAVVGVPIAEA